MKRPLKFLNENSLAAALVFALPGLSWPNRFSWERFPETYRWTWLRHCNCTGCTDVPGVRIDCLIRDLRNPRQLRTSSPVTQGRIHDGDRDRSGEAAQLSASVLSQRAMQRLYRGSTFSSNARPFPGVVSFAAQIRRPRKCSAQSLARVQHGQVTHPLMKDACSKKTRRE